jgi:hypothetical protein
MNRLNILLCVTLIFLSISKAQAGKLLPDSPEFKQLQAMGYEVEPQDNKYLEVSNFSNGYSLLSVDRSNERIAISRNFTRKKLDEAGETTLLSLVNEINQETAYQVHIHESGIAFVMYLFGPYNSRAFATVVRNIERVTVLFETKPELFKLLTE